MPKVIVPPVIVPPVLKKPDVIVAVAPVRVRVLVPISKRVTVALPFMVKALVTVKAIAAVTLAEEFVMLRLLNDDVPLID